MVLLKVVAWFVVVAFVMRFTFHYGSIKRVFASCATFITCLFTFHYGSIKSQVVDIEDYKYLIFTFHYGSIKRQYQRFHLLPLSYLHSTMVLLKVRIMFYL